ncbi:hypothetical protein ACFWYW_57820 [Nonomuraea sp. NPDC059023]|uniref:hypothetical protein n=1 Tax=unclassified Nonomuraea TaxID=2593643 RepID=UPI0036932ADC
MKDYAMLALLLDRLIHGTVLIYRGPEEWRREAGARPAPDPGELAGLADRLLDGEPSPYVAAQLRAMRAVARHLAGERLPLAGFAGEVLGVRPGWRPEEEFARAHDLLDRALPKGPGTLAVRLAAWQDVHRLTRMELLPELVAEAAAECRARTESLAGLPGTDRLDCQVVSGVPYHAAGHHDGGSRSTIYVNGDLPFNVADLLYVVAHEGYPGHIAESLVISRAGLPEQRVRFMLSPSFLVSEGLGLCAQEIVFPGGQAREWLDSAMLPRLGIRPDGADLAAIHTFRNVVWGVWANAAFLAAEGRPDGEVAAYLSRWALLSEEEAGLALAHVRPSVLTPYLFGYSEGWRVVKERIGTPDQIRHLLSGRALP